MERKHRHLLVYEYLEGIKLAVPRMGEGLNGNNTGLHDSLQGINFKIGGPGFYSWDKYIICYGSTCAYACDCKCFIAYLTREKSW